MNLKPFLKWVGGKRQLISDISEYIPNDISEYVEPFVGGGAIFFHQKPNRAIINDLNSELINVYSTIKDNVEELIIDLRKHENISEYYYEIRKLDRDNNIFSKLSNVERASRIIFLNKTCFNGLYRVNSKGEYNSPFGRYKSPKILDIDLLRSVSTYLNDNDIKIYNYSYQDVLNMCTNESFVYLDPPYHQLKNDSFTAYNKGGWGENEQILLKEACDELTKKGIRFLLSNSNTDFIKDLYKEYDINSVYAKRSINSDGNSRGKIEEFLIKNY